MAVKIKLMRMGKMRAPYYRVVVADARTRRDGRAIETIGKYHPKQDPSFIEVDSERVQYWLGVGAQPTEAVAAILRVTGDWQQFRGEPAPPPMKMAAPKVDRRAVFETAALEGLAGDESGGATTPRKRAKKPDEAPEAAAGAAVERTAEPAAELPVEPAAEPAIEPAAELPVEPAAEPAIEPAAELPVEPAAELPVEPAAANEPASADTSDS